MCAGGGNQSPINIEKSVSVEGHKEHRLNITTFGKADIATVHFTGTALGIHLDDWSTEPVVTIPANEKIVGEGEDLEVGDPVEVHPLQFHFHTFSEHTLEGFYAPAELHIVAKVKEGQSEHCDSFETGCLAVFGIMLTFTGDGIHANKGVRKVFRHLPHSAGRENGYNLSHGINLDDLLPENLSYYTYTGSLTTPGCDEVVTWHVFENPVPISRRKFHNHQKMVSFAAGPDCQSTYNDVCVPPREKTNDREIQPLNDRTLTYHEF